jgi:hypothetical protein
MALALVSVVLFAAAFNISSFPVWEYDGGHPPGRRPPGSALPPAGNLTNSVKMGACWQLEPSLNFYCDKNRLTWMLPVEPGSLVPGGGFYALMAAHRPVIGTLGLKPIEEWQRSGSVLAVPGDAR